MEAGSVDAVARLTALELENARLKEEVALMRAQLAGNAQAPPPPATPEGEGSCPRRTFETAHGMTKAQVERYSRQILLPQFGVAAQDALCRASVLIVGCGGLGAPAALYLAAAGVGRLGLVDHDAVELSNLHRQIIHSEARVGLHKADSAAMAVAGLNSGVGVDLHREGLRPDNAAGIVAGYDVVIDASDNPPTRYLISDACVVHRKPLVSAAAVGTDGQLTVYCHGDDGPCYRCLFPEAPAPENCSRCADAGVLGVVPGIMGCLQALEAIKIISGVGEPLSKRLTLFDALAARFSTVKLRARVPSCAACGAGSSFRNSPAAVAAYDYVAFTGQQPHDKPAPPLAVIPMDERLEPLVFQERMLAFRESKGRHLLLDVRPEAQFAVAHLPGAINIPYLQFDRRMGELMEACTAAVGAPASNATCSSSADGAAANGSTATGADAANGPIFVVCRRGNHSQLAVQRLRAAGYSEAIDLIGGMAAWGTSVDEAMPNLG